MAVLDALGVLVGVLVFTVEALVVQVGGLGL
jgi:hypothetical protein